MTCLPAASVARHLYMRSPSGVKAMRKIYGGRYRNGVKPSHFCPASASVARKALQALEQLKLVEQDPSGSVPSPFLSLSLRVFVMPFSRPFSRVGLPTLTKAKPDSNGSLTRLFRTRKSERLLKRKIEFKELILAS